MRDYDYRHFDAIPNGTAFADKYGRVHTKHSVGCSSEHNNGSIEDVTFDDSREYFEADEEELEDCGVFDAWPYCALPNVKPAPSW